MRISCKKSFTLFMGLFIVLNIAHARDHLIFSVNEEINMGYKDRKTKRNYYMNIGANQGVTEGTILNVYRVISKSNPYDNKKRVNYKVAIGQLEVAHSENESSIGYVKSKNDSIKHPMFEINNFMIGDSVEVFVK